MELIPAAGVTVSGVSVVNSGRILATLAVDAGVPPGSLDITVTNADGGQGAVATFNAAMQVVDPPHADSWKYRSGKLQIQGTDFHPSMQAYVGGSSTPWPYITVKRNSIVVLNRVQKVFLKGTEVTVRLVNPDDGGETTIIVAR